MQVLRANNAGTAGLRRAELLALREMIESLLLTMRVAKEVKAFKSFTGYLFVVEQVGSVARQNEGCSPCTRPGVVPWKVFRCCNCSGVLKPG